MARNMEYVNMSTGEWTDNHRDAVEWNRDGDVVAVICNGAIRTTWERPAYFEQ